MKKQTKIAWADYTFNPVLGCEKVSPGCAHCYAESIATRFKNVAWGKDAPRVRTSAKYWGEMEDLNKISEQENFRICHACGTRYVVKKSPNNHNDCGCGGCKGSTQTSPRIFCGSMCDFLDDAIPNHWFLDLIFLITHTPHLEWLLLTKRPQNFFTRLNNLRNDVSPRYPGYSEFRDWFRGKQFANIQVGVSVENQEAAERRIPLLLEITAKVRFLSCEPLLENLDLHRWTQIKWQCGKCGEYFSGELKDECPNCEAVGYWSGSHKFNGRNLPRKPLFSKESGSGIDWIICGGESGPKARPMHPDYANSLLNQCQCANVPFFFKQWGDTSQKTFDIAPGAYPTLEATKQFPQPPTLSPVAPDKTTTVAAPHQNVGHALPHTQSEPKGNDNKVATTPARGILNAQPGNSTNQPHTTNQPTNHTPPTNHQPHTHHDRT